MTMQQPSRPNPKLLPAASLLALTLLAACSSNPATPQAGPVAAPPPETAREAVLEDYHGTQVADPYRWLEDQDGERTQAWVTAQNQVSQKVLAAIPRRSQIRQRIQELWSFPRRGAPFQEGEAWFQSRNDGLQNQSVIYRTDGPNGTNSPGEDTVFLDPNLLSEDGTVALGGMSFSEDGSLLAYSTSKSGSDWRDWQVMEVASGKLLADKVSWSKFSGAAWTHDQKGFFYQRFPAPKEGETFQQQNLGSQLCYHELGTEQSEDKVIYQRPDHPTWGFGAWISDDGAFSIIRISEGTDARNRIAYLDLQKAEAQVQGLIMELEASYRFLGNDGRLCYFLTDQGADRRRIIAIHLDRPERDAWQELVAESADTLESVQIIGDHFFLTYLRDAHSVLQVRKLDGELVAEPTLPSLGSISGLQGKRLSKQAYFSFSSFVQPSGIYSYSITSGELLSVHQPKLTFKPQDFVTKQVFYQSKDGTRVPMFLVYKKGLRLDGNNPTYLYGYGGFNISLKPRFSSQNIAWLEMGGIYAQPSLRGGGEFGRAWHEAGMGKSKQNVFDDFIDAAEYLQRNGYTRREKLAIGGGSNGGLLVGAILTQRPELVGAAIPEVGVMDMLRYHKFTIGHAWIPEFGSSEDPEMFPTLYGYSPLHNLREGTSYPATMVMTGDHDDRVLPGHSYKFAAAMQRAQAGPAPILIRIDQKSGHGAGKPTSKRIDAAADRWAFLSWALQI